MRGINESCPCVVFQAEFSEYVRNKRVLCCVVFQEEFSEYVRNKRVLSLCCVSGGVL